MSRLTIIVLSAIVLSGTLLTPSATLLAQPNWVSEVPDEATFEAISIESRTRPDIRDTGKYILPAREDAELLPTSFQNVNVYRFHLDFLTGEFPDRFPGMTVEEYRRLVEIRASREYYAGAIFRIVTPENETLYGFDFYTDASRGELPLQEEAEWVWRRLSERFALRPLVYAPIPSAAVAEVSSWADTPFDIYLPDQGITGTYSLYTGGVAYGRLRIFTLEELLATSGEGSLSFTDVVVVDEAPGDLTSPVAGLISGTPQVELSHLNLRLAQRGTPNCFFAAWDAELSAFRDLLVRIEVDAGGVAIREVEDLEEAEAFWRDNRPRLAMDPSFDLSAESTAPFVELREDENGLARYGAKATNLALLSGIFPPENVTDGFGIPVSWYEHFMNSNLIPGPGAEFVTYAEYLDLLQADERFRTDAVHRTRTLRQFIAYAETNGRVRAEFTAEAIGRIRDLTGGTDIKVRFRSSSNVEDIVPFNGAGLYESTSACVADTLDGDSAGPSLCNPLTGRRSLERAFKRVWTSLWLPRAYNEREFWQVPHELSKMGILCNPAFVGEAANGVVLSGNPAVPGDDRVLINVQIGEESVVHPDPGILPEKLLVEVANGTATRVDRVRPSSLMPEGEWILSIDEARRVGELVSLAVEELGPRYETDLGDILLDFEFKVVVENDARRVVFKQVRPFLRATTETDAVELAINVPEGTEACGLFAAFRGLDSEYELLSTLRFRPGRFAFDPNGGTLELFDEVLVGPMRIPAIAEGPGRMSCERQALNDLEVVNCTYRQDFSVGGTPLALEFLLPAFRFPRGDDDPARRELQLDENFLSLTLARGIQSELSAVYGDPLDGLTIRWGSCSLATLPRFVVEASATTGESLRLESRHEPAFVGTGPENLIRAELDLGGGARTITDYWQLVHAADFHNWNRRFRVVLAEPWILPGGEEVAAVDFHEPLRFAPAQPPLFLLLDQNFEVLRSLEIAAWSRGREQDPSDPEFTRGDSNLDGEVNISDAIRTLDFLFGQSAPSLACPDAADADDDGRINITDAIRTVFFLFSGGPILPHPGPERCGRDAVPDALPACSFDIAVCGEF